MYFEEKDFKKKTKGEKEGTTNVHVDKGALCVSVLSRI
jgi:hypothetical protein